MQAPDGSTHVPVDAPAPKDALSELFTYHAATPRQEEDYRAIRGGALSLARIIDRCCAPGPDRTTAIRKLREAVMTANASIATNNASYR
jgi:hypothetical protein